MLNLLNGVGAIPTNRSTDSVAPAVPPEFTVNPTVQGVLFSGGVLSLTGGTTVPAASSYTYQWKRDGSNISGATNATLQLTVTDEGTDITCQVTPVNAAGSGTPVTVAAAYEIGATSMAIRAADNTTTTASATFTSSDVDTGANTVNLSGLTVAYVSDFEWTKFYFSTTGTPPAGLTNGQAVYLKNTTGNLHKIYKVATDADYASFNGYVNGEDIPPGAFAFYDIPIDLTDGGSGTHTLSSQPLAATIADVSGNGSSYTKTPYNAMLEVLGSGADKYFDLEGVLGLKLSVSSQPYYGKALTPANQGTAAGDKRAGKRFLGMILRGEIPHTNYVGVSRVHIVPANVNTTNDEITFANGHGFTTGDAVNVQPIGSSTLPAGLTAGTYYARSVSSAIFTLHPTSGDASANTNKVNITDTGTGIFAVTDLNTARHQDRRMIFDLNQSGNDHTFSPQTSMLTSNAVDFTNVAFNIGLWFHAFSQYNGDLSGDQILSASRIGTDWTKLKVRLFIPPGSTGWVRQDTGLNLVSGTYWITKTPGETFFRLHDTEADADASIGVATASATCIKYVTTNSGNDGKGTGTGRMFLEDKTIFRPFNDSISLTGNPWKMMSTNEGEAVYVTYVDFTGNSTNRTWYAGKDSLTNYLNAAVTNIATGTGVVPASSVNSNILIGNAAEPHVSGQAKIKEMYAVMGDDPTLFTNQMQASLDYLMGL